MSLKFEPLTPRQDLKPWNKSPQVLESICQNLSVHDLCKFAQLSRHCKQAAYLEKWWVDRLYNLDLVDNLKQGQDDGEATLIEDDLSPLDALDTFEYRSGHAREGFMKLHRIFSPLYEDLVSSGRHAAEPLAFRVYRDPVDQAKVLGQIKQFSRADPLEQNHEEKVSQLHSTIDLFENAALAEFELGYDEHDMERVKQYAAVLITLNGGDNCVQLFIQKHPLLYNREPEDPNAYFKDDNSFDFDKFQEYLQNIAELLNKEAVDIDKVFPETTPVMLPLFEHVLEDNIMDLVSRVIDKTRTDSLKRYLRLVPEIYTRLRWFRGHLEPSRNTGERFALKVQHLIDESYSLYADQYSAEELQAFIDDAESHVEKWKQDVTKQEQARETFLWSNVAKEQDKSDFLSSFKKVLMMPVNVIPFQGNASTSSVNNNTSKTPNPQHQFQTPTQSTPSTPNLQSETPPTTELDAMMAVMNSKLENISTLFSLELALGIIRNGRDAIERLGKLVTMSGRSRQEVKEQCEQVFVELVRIVGGQHVKGGFDRALETLNSYDPRQFRRIITNDGDKEDEAEGEKNAVEPLAIFAELVNIGDLIQQMIHVFFEEELALRKYIDRNDFLSPAVKAKKRFEQTLDDSVANGLNRGIDVLVDQIDFIFVTIQLGSDFNPGAAGFTELSDVGPTKAAKKVVSLLSSHVSLLQGSTEKSVIDVFQQEIGVRFFASICKHLKRQTISTDGAIKLISDINYYYSFIASLRQREVMPYFEALKEIGQLYLIDGSDSKALGRTLSDMSRFRGVLQPEEVFEFVQCRADWLLVRKDVERVMYGFGIDCMMM